jgi:hypothetical protein
MKWMEAQSIARPAKGCKWRENSLIWLAGQTLPSFLFNSRPEMFHRQ